ncbi:MAG: hypothetical protein AAF909_12435 [Pseudomonadota bacterium]
MKTVIIAATVACAVATAALVNIGLDDLEQGPEERALAQQERLERALDQERDRWRRTVSQNTAE